MPYISEHHTEQEGEGDYSEITWIYFFIIWDSIGIRDLLEGHREFISPNKSWRGLGMILPFKDLGCFRPSRLRELKDFQS